MMKKTTKLMPSCATSVSDTLVVYTLVMMSGLWWMRYEDLLSN